MSIKPTEWVLKMIFKGTGCFQFPEAVVTTAKESLHSTKLGSLRSSHCFIGVVTAANNCTNFGSKGKPML